MKAEEKASLALGLAIGSFLCGWFTGIPAFFVSRGALKSLPPDSPERKRAKLAFVISAIVCSFWLLVVGFIMVSGLAVSLSPELRRKVDEAQANAAKQKQQGTTTPGPGELKLKDFYVTMARTPAKDRPGAPGSAPYMLREGQEVCVLDTTFHPDENGTQHWWVQVEFVLAESDTVFSKSKRPDLLKKSRTYDSVTAWLYEPRLKPK